MTINSLPVLHDHAEKKSARFRDQARDHVPSFDTHASVLSSESSPQLQFCLLIVHCTDLQSLQLLALLRLPALGTIGELHSYSLPVSAPIPPDDVSISVDSQFPL
jgi:hypothetical protein